MHGDAHRQLPRAVPSAIRVTSTTQMDSSNTRAFTRSGESVVPNVAEEHAGPPGERELAEHGGKPRVDKKYAMCCRCADASCLDRGVAQSGEPRPITPDAPERVRAAARVIHRNHLRKEERHAARVGCRATLCERGIRGT